MSWCKVHACPDTLCDGPHEFQTQDKPINNVIDEAVEKLQRIKSELPVYTRLYEKLDRMLWEYHNCV